jgi:predicted amidohydrolase YtcJ
VDIPRFGQLAVVASVQPWFMYYPSQASAVFLARLGAERGDRAFPWHSLSASGATLVFGTDFPVGGIGEDPILDMFCAIRRQFADGTDWQPQERVDAELALAAYTANPARIIGWGDRLGRIAVGYQADLVVLDRDPRLAAAGALSSNPIRSLMIAGKDVTTGMQQ